MVAGREPNALATLGSTNKDSYSSKTEVITC
jgi:hypothetical protein